MAAKMSYYIDAPVESVFDFFMDPNNQVDTPVFGDMKVHEVKMTKEGVGSYYGWSVKMFGIPITGFEVVTDFVPNKRITEKSSNAMVGTWEYTFEPEGSGTKVTMEHRQRSFWAVPPLRNLMDYAVPRLSRSYIKAAKAELETKAAVPSQRKPASTKPRKPAASR
ncbi:MAG TPA: SRPBCC family protein [Nocardioidaceae bacterium]|nr:SRPBCC family protein [Nocardioidaceae bacterium]